MFARLEGRGLQESIASHSQWVRGLVVTALGSALALLATFLVVALVTGRQLIGEPVQRLVAFAQRVGDGDFGARSDVTSRNELGELGRHLDSMAGALLSARARVQLEEAKKHAAEERLHHAERLTTVGKLAAGIAHELWVEREEKRAPADVEQRPDDRWVVIHGSRSPPKSEWGATSPCIFRRR